MEILTEELRKKDPLHRRKELFTSLNLTKDIIKETYTLLPILHTAVEQKNNIEIIKYLVENRADVNSKDIKSRSVYRQNDIEIIKHLIENGAEVNERFCILLLEADKYGKDIASVICFVEKGC